MEGQTQDSKYDVLHKVLVVGDSGVGKHDLVSLLVTGSVATPTTRKGGKVGFKTLHTTHQDTQHKIQLWDTTGQEKFGTISPVFLRGTHVILFVYDTAKPESFENIKKWIHDCKTHDCHRILVAFSRCESRVVSRADGGRFAEERNFIYQDVNVNTKRSLSDLVLAMIGHPICKALRTRSIERLAISGSK